MSQTGRRILMVSDHSDPLAPIGSEEAGGQNVYVRQLSKALCERGQTVDIVTRRNQENLPLQEKAKGGYRVHRVVLGPKGFLPKEEFIEHLPAFQEAIQSLCTRNQYDIVHSHYWLSGIGALPLQQSHHLPIVQTFHSLGKMKHAALRGIAPEHQKEREHAEQSIIKSVECLLAESQDERRMLINHYHADPQKITVIPAGVDIAHFRPGDMMEARKKLDLPIQGNVLLFVGRFVAQKGLNYLLHAFAQMLREIEPDERKKTVLLLVGGSQDAAPGSKEHRQQKRIHTLLEHLNITENVRLEGQMPNRRLPVYYQAATVCIVPSKYEPFGIVPLESMACGTPVIASFVGGMKTTVRNLVTGFHARNKSIPDLAYKMRILIQNPALQQEFSKQARLHIEQGYSWESIADRILVCYNSVLAANEQ